MNNKKIIRDDINFLEHPNWVINEKTKQCKLIVEKENGRYELLNPRGLPNHFDKTIFYYLLHVLFNELKAETLEINTNRYTITKNVLPKVTSAGKDEFKRIIDSLKKWKALSITFEGIFYSEDNQTIRCFAFIDDVIFDKKTKNLYIRFNQQYIQHLIETKHYQLIDFEIYKKLSKPVAARLYEILLKSFIGRRIWHIDIKNLAEKLTLAKRPNTKDYYPSDVLKYLKLGLEEINEKTDLNIDFEYNKSNFICKFKKLKGANISDEIIKANEDILVVPAVKEKENKQNTNEALKKLLFYGIPVSKAQLLVEKYEQKQIEEKIKLMEQQEVSIKNSGAWLIKALEENWQEFEYSKQKEQQKIKQELIKKKQQEETRKLELDRLRKEFMQYKESKALDIYKNLPKPLQENIDQQFKIWVSTESKLTKFPLPHEILKINFLIKMLIDENDQDFNKWATVRGYKLNQL